MSRNSPPAKVAWTAILIVLGGLLGCHTGHPDVRPYINDVGGPDSLRIDQSADYWAVITPSDQDFAIRWSEQDDAGSFRNAEKVRTTWTTPHQPGTYSIIIHASNDIGMDTRAITTTVYDSAKAEGLP